MIELLNEISESPEILGACVYSAEHGVLAANLPVRVSSSVQQKVGELLHQISALKDIKTLDISTFEIQFNESLLLAKTLINDTTLFALCQADANLSLASMSLNLASDDLSTKIAQKSSVSAPSTVAQSSVRPKSTKQRQSYAEVINGPLAAELQMIKAELSKTIGPFTGIVMEDGINEWLQKGMSQPSELNELIEILSKEIEEQKPRQSFINNLTTLFLSPTKKPEAGAKNSTEQEKPAQAEQHKEATSGAHTKTRIPKSFGGQFF